ncbi:MAG: tail completion protein [Enterobacter phage ENC7]|nr:MAG: tail completion protein [Enterobacter phage ENC7]UIW11750.1 MAG: tail completion protein [Enterobacter phage ENC25]UIW12008.1 MAG: tail completion protein [Enterobacter phage ENC22]
MTTETNAMILNQISPSNFMLDIPDNDFVKGLKLQIQGVTLPSINIPITDIPGNPMVRSKIPGSAIEFDPLVIRFIVDEELRSYLGVYLWMLSTCDFNTFDSLSWQEPKQAMALHVLDNSQGKTIATFRFYGAWPSNLGELELMYTNDTDEAVTCMSMFNFHHMEIEIDGRVIVPTPRKTQK